MIQPDRTKTIINAETLAAASTYTGSDTAVPVGATALTIQSKFVRAAGGTTTKVYVQTSLDGGATWIDIMCHAFATTTATKISGIRTDVALAAAYAPTDASLADDTIKDGLIGDRIRVKYVVAGTYTGASSLTVTGVFQ